MSRVVLPGQKEFVASVMFIADTEPEQVLLVHHKKYDLWVQPGGHIDFGENPLQAAIREAEEETGIDISPFLKAGDRVDSYAFPLPIPDLFVEEKIPAYGDSPEHFHLDLVYSVHLLSAVEVRLEEAGANDIRWYTREEAKKLKSFQNTQWMLDQLMQSKA